MEKDSGSDCMITRFMYDVRLVTKVENTMELLHLSTAVISNFQNDLEHTQCSSTSQLISHACQIAQP